VAVFIALVWLAFQGLAVCTFCGMQTTGFTASIAIATAVVAVIIGAVIVRAMYRKTYGIT